MTASELSSTKTHMLIVSLPPALEIRDLIAKEVSTFRNEASHAFLSIVETFMLSVWSDDNGAVWGINTLPDT
jgi:hypothetical protein